MNGADKMTIAAIEGLIGQVQDKINHLSDVNAIQVNAKAIASSSLAYWERNELFELQKVYEEVETS
jgi:hypothetical protein